MKKLFLLLAIMGIVVIGCTKDEVDKGNDNEDGQKVTFSAEVAYDDREATFWS